MAQILIRKLDDTVAQQLRVKAANEGVSAEEEARRILRKALEGESTEMPMVEYARTAPKEHDTSILDDPRSNPRNVTS